MSAGLETLNGLPEAEAEAELLKCCGSTLWARRMAAARPFESLDVLLSTAEAVWWALDAEDWLEAFSRHPKIGESESARAQAAQAKGWSEQEQSGVQGAAAETRRELLEGNRQYQEKFGHIYIVCATGKSADEMLAGLRERLGNDRETELRNAAEEQRKITELRLRKLLEA